MKEATVVTPDPVDVVVGSNLRAGRMRLGITQSELGQKLGVTFQQIQKYEKGSNRVSASMLSRAAKALECRVEDFFPAAEGEGDQSTPIGSVTGGHELAKLYLAMSSDRRKMLLQLARELA